MSRYICVDRFLNSLALAGRTLAALEKECVMERNDDRSVEALIDLGSVVEETKGNAPGMGDSFALQQQAGIGLADD